MALLLFQLTAKRNLDVFWGNLLILALFFRIFFPAFVSAVFSFCLIFLSIAF